MRLMIAVLISVASCGVQNETTDTEQAFETAGNPAVWMLGSWNCTTIYDTLAGRFQRHSAAGVYTFTDEGLDFQGHSLVNGQYTEVPVDPEFTALDFVENYTIGNSGSPTVNAPAEQDVLLSDGSTIIAVGTARGDDAGLFGGQLLGATSLRGVLTFSDGEVRGWSGGMTGVAAATGKRFSLNRNINQQPGVNPQVQLVYMQSSCLRLE